ncbi:MAG: SMC family ATPase [Dehalococcoidia bacterium]
MIPRRLRIRNFLSYRDCEVDLTGLRLAVLCGPNGNGKSALLDAMTWALWGEGRGRLEDDRIHLGEQDMLVDFEFEASGDLFQVVRKRTRGKASGSLEFLQVNPEGGRTSLTGNVVSETQAEIIRKLRMDYDTFVNSAFIAQGRANEFTKKRPADRKEVFRNVLGLERYQEVAEAAGERRKDAVSALKELERNVGEASQEVATLPALEKELVELGSERTGLEPDSRRLEEHVLELRQAASEHDRLKKDALSAMRNVETLRTTTGDLEKAIARFEAELEGLRSKLARAAEIRDGYERLQCLREQEQALSAAQQKGQSLQDVIANADTRVSVERARIEGELDRARRDLVNARELESTLEALRGEDRRIANELSAVERMVASAETGAEEAEKRRRKASEAKGLAERIRDENAALKERESQLDEAEANCPICLRELSPGDVDHVRVEYAREREHMRARFEEAKGERARLLDQADALTAEATSTRDNARRQETLLRQRERELAARLPAAEEAERAIPVLHQAVDALAAVLDAEEFALEARAERGDALARLAEVGYDAHAHAALRQQMAGLVGADADYQGLLVAEERADSAAKQLARERSEFQTRGCELTKAEAALVRAHAALALAEDVQPRLDEAQENLSAVRRRDSELALHMGQLQARRDALVVRQSQVELDMERMQGLKEEDSVFGDLAKAFGRDGIQAMLIDQSLPRVEHTANDMLDRMTGGRIHVNLATQRQSASGKITETLDIRISDEIGTRDYEMYSGGEAFRVDFALRIALARLLAERAGATLPTLIIDEGFGSQDAEGIDRLVQAITAIQDEFRLILVVTHIEELKERFERRIEVTKDHPRGSLARVI